jgi:hypothetical protein
MTALGRHTREDLEVHADRQGGIGHPDRSYMLAQE